MCGFVVNFDMVKFGHPSSQPFANLIKPPFLFCPLTFYTALRCCDVHWEQFGGYRGGLEPTLMAGIYCSNLSLIRNQESRNLGQSASWKLTWISCSVLIQLRTWELKQCGHFHVNASSFMIPDSFPLHLQIHICCKTNILPMLSSSWIHQ